MRGRVLVGVWGGGDVLFTILGIRHVTLGFFFFLFFPVHRIQPRYVDYGAHFGQFQSAVRVMAACYGCVDMDVVQFSANTKFFIWTFVTNGPLFSTTATTTTITTLL